jgi:CRISPR system Cascade subunit CasB
MIMSTATTATNKLEREVRFLKSVCDRIQNDSGAKAGFKRALSGESEHIRKVYPFVLPFLGGVSDWEQEHVWIPVACLAVYYPQAIREDDKYRNFGKSCEGLAKATTSEGADRRFRALLDLSLEDIYSPLTALVRQLKSKGIAIDYPRLLSDLRQWDHADQYIQDRWARTFWGAVPKAGEPQ